MSSSRPADLLVADVPDQALVLHGPGNAGAIGAPWTVTEDNSERLEVKDDRGETVWLEDWSGLPDDFTPHQRQVIVKSVRARIYATVSAVNCHAALLTQLAQARHYVAAVARRSSETRVHDDLAKIDAALSQAMVAS